MTSSLIYFPASPHTPRLGQKLLGNRNFVLPAAVTRSLDRADSQQVTKVCSPLAFLHLSRPKQTQKSRHGVDQAVSPPSVPLSCSPA